jgi:hypothetical protein
MDVFCKDWKGLCAISETVNLFFSPLKHVMHRYFKNIFFKKKSIHSGHFYLKIHYLYSISLGSVWEP